MNDQEFLNWVADRLVHVYNDESDEDHVLRLRNIAENGSPKLAVTAGYTVQVGNRAIDPHEYEVDIWPTLEEAEEFADVLRKIGRINRRGVSVRPVLLGPPVPAKVAVTVEEPKRGQGGWPNDIPLPPGLPCKRCNGAGVVKVGDRWKPCMDPVHQMVQNGGGGWM